MDNFNSVEQVLDFAIAREVEAYNFYDGLVGRVDRPDTRKALQGFAQDEVNHRKKLQRVKAGEITLTEEDVGSLGIAERVADVQLESDMSYVDMLAAGMKKEKKSYWLYTYLASKAKTQQLRDMLLSIAQEEANHKLRLEIEYDLTTF